MADWTSSNQTAYDIMLAELKNFGLEGLAPALHDIILNGITDQNQIQLQLQNTEAWKNRFRGNEILKGQGLSPLSPAEYVATERAYAQVMKNYGLPTGFYDDSSDFAGFIGHSVSPAEMQQRVSKYADVARREDPALLQQLGQMGMTEGDLLAYMMDPNRAMPIIERKYNTALIGATALRAGVSSSNAEHLASLGITEDQAKQGYDKIGSELHESTLLGNIYNDQIAQTDLESEVFEGNGGAARKRKRLASQERAAFSGSAGTAQGSLGRNSSGSY